MNIMRNIIGLVFGLLVTAGLALGQQATELYIPIGQSPGLSAREAVVGTIARVDEANGRMTITSNGTSVIVTIGEKTIYYLDSSHVQRRNYPGTFEHCEIGRRVEVRVDTDGYVEWIKIAVP